MVVYGALRFRYDFRLQPGGAEAGAADEAMQVDGGSMQKREGTSTGPTRDRQVASARIATPCSPSWLWSSLLLLSQQRRSLWCPRLMLMLRLKLRVTPRWRVWRESGASGRRKAKKKERERERADASTEAQRLAGRARGEGGCSRC